MLSSEPINHTVVRKLTVEDQIQARKARDAEQMERESNQARAEKISRKNLIAHKTIRSETIEEDTTAEGIKTLPKNRWEIPDQVGKKGRLVHKEFCKTMINTINCNMILENRKENTLNNIKGLRCS